MKTLAVSGDLDYVRVEIHAVRPGVAFGHGNAEVDRLRDELAELIGKPVDLHILQDSGPPKGRAEVTMGPAV